MRSFSFYCFILGLFFNASEALAQNGYLTGLNIPRYTKVGVDYPISVRAYNAGNTAFNFFQVSWRLNGGTVHTMNQSVGTPGVIGSSFMPVTHPQQLNAAQGQHTLKVWITVPGDTDPSNDTLTVNFTALDNWAPKVVLMELRTETWCPVCPPANTATNIMMDDPGYAVAKFHMSDGFEFDDAVEYFAQYYTQNLDFTPAGVIELGEYGEYQLNADHNLWPAQMSARTLGASPVHISMNSTLNNNTRVLSVTIDATFTYPITGPFKLNVYLTENHVPGPQAGLGENYLHQGLMRAMLGGADGTSGVIPNAPLVGNTYSHTYTYTVPEEFELAHLYLLGIVEHAPGPNSRYALNSLSSAHAPVNVQELAAGSFNMSVYPNPFESTVRLDVQGMNGAANLQMHSLDGRMLMVRNIILDMDGRCVIDLGNDLPEGVYILSINDGRSVVTQKVSRVSH